MARDPLPDFIDPMLATLGSLPLKGDDSDWVFERKWDGVRAIVRWDGKDLTLTSRNQLDMTGGYPELAGLGADFSGPVILDAEIVALDSEGRSSFSLLQRRIHVTSSAAKELAQNDPAVLMVFDVLHLDGHSLLEQPWSERRSLLEGLGLDAPSWRTPAAIDGSAEDAVALSRREQLEGIVAKRRDSIYRAGRRNPDWTKVKNFRTQEVIVGGWRPGAGSRDGTIGSLLLGIPADGGLQYIGRVGTGFTAAILTDLLSQLQRLSRKTSPFADIPRRDAADAEWVTPSLVGEVTFAEWTTDGRLRHPAWRGLRPDKEPAQVVRES